MRYYATQTFLVRDLGDDFIYLCSFCGAKANFSIESLGDRDSTYHYHCSCNLATRQKNLSDKIFNHLNEISKLKAVIKALPLAHDMIRSKEYEYKLRKLNNEYFPISDDGKRKHELQG